MQISQAREQYVRWLAVTKDLSPHTIRAYNGDIAALASAMPNHELGRPDPPIFANPQSVKNVRRATGPIMGVSSLSARSSRD